jgi:hypothetical protein
MGSHLLNRGSFTYFAFINDNQSEEDPNIYLPAPALHFLPGVPPDMQCLDRALIPLRQFEVVLVLPF